MRASNAETIGCSIGGMSAPRSSSRLPRSSWRATTAHDWRETTCERIFASRPSVKSGYRSNSARATASSRTLSPRNSSRSYDEARSGAHDEWVKTGSRRSEGSTSIRRSSSVRVSSVRLLMRGDVVDRLADGLDLLGVLVRDLDAELVLQLHDQLHEVE